MAVITVEVYVRNLATVLGLFDKLQIHRSKTGELGVYEEITGAAAAAAEVTGTQASPFSVNGLTLILKVDEGSEQTYTFSTTDPISVDDVADALNDPTTGLSGVTASEATGALLKLTSDTTGTGSTIEITGGTALTELGLTAEKYHGVAERPTLVGTDYTVVDNAGDASYFYKSRFYNSSTQAVSSFSDPVEGDLSSIIAAINLVTASGDIAKPNGQPVEGMRVSFKLVYVDQALVVDSIGVLGHELTVTTDAAGHLETLLVKGAIVDVTFAGTGVSRRITVPDTDFDLLDAVSNADDIFQIQTHTIPAAPRRS